MNANRKFSLFLIAVVFLPLVITLTQDYDFAREPIGKELGPKFQEEFTDAPHEFRETFKISVSASTRTRVANFFYSVPSILFSETLKAQYVSYLNVKLSTRPSVKKFIDLGSLII